VRNSEQNGVIPGHGNQPIMTADGMRLQIRS
jgi:hypothetical protein